MAMNVFRRVITSSPLSSGKKVSLPRFYSLYEPDYLETGKPKMPHYPDLNVKLQGYTYSILQKYQSFIHKIMHSLDIKIEESFAFPAQELSICRYKPGGTIVVAEYNIYIYERHFRITNVTTTQCSLLIRTLEAALPEGVTITIDTWNPLVQKKRYIPDTTLLKLKTELAQLIEESQ